MSAARASAVSAYYDRNTQAFLLQGRRDTGAIHRELWAPGVATRTDALTHVNGLVAEHLPRQGGLLDLGCGVGGTAAWLTQRNYGPIVGITNSAVQARIGGDRIRAAGMEGRVAIRHGSYLQLAEAGVAAGSAAGAYAIESFIHSPDAAGFFRSAAQALRPGGTLVVCDDFLGPPARGRQPRAVLRRVATGWLATSLVSVAEAGRIAAVAGLTLRQTDELTQYHRYHGRLKRLWMHAVTALPIPHPYWRSLRGGLALQIALQRGWIRHALLVFGRSEAA